MRATLLPLALGTLLISALSACSVNYYVGGTRYQQAPQPAYNYDYPPQQPPTTVVVVPPVRTPQPPIRTTPPVRNNPPVRNPQPPIRTNPSAGNGPTRQPGGSQPTNGGVLAPTAPPKPMPTTSTGSGNGPTRQPDRGPELAPTAPPKPMPTNPSAGSTNNGPTRQPDRGHELLPTAPPKPMPSAPAGTVKAPATNETVEQHELMPTAPPKPAPTTTTAAPVREASLEQQPAAPELMPTAPPKPAPTREGSVKHEAQVQPAQEQHELMPTAPPKPAPTNAEPAPGGSEAPIRPQRGRIREVVQNAQAPAQSAGAPVIVLRKTPCFGFCPYFEASIYADGRVHYVGHSNVAKVGTYELQVPAEAVRRLLSRAEAVGFGSFQDKYVSGATDLPSTYLTVNRPGQPGKTVQAEEGAPDELKNLIAEVNSLVETVSGGVNPDR